ncbi:hypothetical protein D1953_00150 [Peribacillus asahii]|uniref:Uncharacterized protein n=1 Tax=Peribacillus asahii TaxID=228899 RepID=A0A398BFJ2_9BACI|nr:hypothetical protein [Peribacillus asahii]RID89025.1 hypothetical protein D1953_00150 [Peribacillus asahii]
MKPIQLWLPFFNKSWDTPSFSRDIQRAQRNWLGEDRIWLLPGLNEVKRWSKSVSIFKYHECAIPSETLNCITVVNVSKDGAFYPPIGNPIPEKWKGIIPTNLLNLWLNSSNFGFVSAKKTINLPLPFFKENEVIYKEVEIGLTPGPSFPISEFDEETHEVVLKLTSDENSSVEIISPEAESLKLNGPYQWDNQPTEETLNLVINKDGKKSFHSAILWNEPFFRMFPDGGGMDLLNHRNLMKNCARDIEKNRSKIKLQANNFTKEGWTNLEALIIAPTLMTKGPESLLFDIEGSFNIEVDNLRELLDHPKYKEIFKEKVPVTRIFGWEGYLWWELNKIVNIENKFMKTCSLCGNIIYGKKGKTFCNQEDNLDCYRKRKRLDKRRERKK